MKLRDIILLFKVARRMSSSWNRFFTDSQLTGRYGERRHLIQRGLSILMNLSCASLGRIYSNSLDAVQNGHGSERLAGSHFSQRGLIQNWYCAM